MVFKIRDEEHHIFVCRLNTLTKLIFAMREAGEPVDYDWLVEEWEERFGVGLCKSQLKAYIRGRFVHLSTGEVLAPRSYPAGDFRYDDDQHWISCSWRLQLELRAVREATAMLSLEPLTLNVQEHPASNAALLPEHRQRARL